MKAAEFDNSSKGNPYQALDSGLEYGSKIHCQRQENASNQLPRITQGGMGVGSAIGNWQE
ncbi:MAG: hypothetical protein QGH44_01545 [Arenicellales bacterium]|jgi:hypothetical protein|nr:hypothetical protein [Arenicellales bacterium]